MPRHQKGSLIVKSEKFYVRFYTTDTDNGSQKVMAYLCDVDKEHWYERRRNKLAVSDQVKQLRDQFMLKVNANRGVPQTRVGNPTVGEFWDQTFKPSLTVRGLRPSTILGYDKIWNGDLKSHLEKWKVREYRTPTASRFLTALATERNLGRNTLSHVRACMSSIFSHAVNHGLIDVNPIAGVKIMAKVRRPEPTENYTLDEAKKVLASDAGLDAKCVFALAFFLGLRPSEISGLKWEDLTDDGRLQVRRGVVGRSINPTKTNNSESDLLLIEPVHMLLHEWRVARGSPRTGWMFPNAKNGPLTMASFMRIKLVPAVRKAGVKWKGLYAGRRGAGTVLRNLTGALVASQQVLRHTTLATTDHHYALPSREMADRGLKMLESAWQEGKDE
jgi:integrase